MKEPDLTKKKTPERTCNTLGFPPSASVTSQGRSAEEFPLRSEVLDSAPCSKERKKAAMPESLFDDLENSHGLSLGAEVDTF